MDIIGGLKGAVQGFKDGVSPKAADMPTLDGSPVALAAEIKSWEDNCVRWRDEHINNFFGGRIRGSVAGGMQSLVRAAHLHYTPRQWELPPYSYENLENDNTRLTYPWFFGNIQQILPIASPADMKLTAFPLRGDKKKFAAQANAILAEESEHIKFQKHTKGVVLGGKLYGSQIGYYGHKKVRGDRSIQRVAELCDPLSVLWDIGSDLSNAKYIIYKRWSLIDDVKRMYAPDFEIEPVVIDDKFSSMLTIQGKGQTTNHTRCVETIVYIRDTEQYEEDVYEDQDFALVDGEGSPVLDEEQNPIIKPQSVKTGVNMMDRYPFGRIIVLVNDKIVSDAPNPYHHHRCPFVKYDNHSYPGFFWGLPEWFTAGDIPHVINETVSGMAMSARSGFDKLVIDQSKLETKIEDITNDPSDYIIAKKGMLDNGKVTDTISLGGNNFQYAPLLQSTIQLGDRITGVSDPLRGIPNSSVTSGKQQERISEDSERHIFPQVKDLELYLEDAGLLILFNAVQFRDPSETIEIVSNVGGLTQEFKIQDFPKDTEFHIKVSSNSGLPTDRKERMKVLLETIQSVITVFQQSPEFADAIVSLSDIPEIEEAWATARVKLEQQQLMMQQQAMLQQPTQPTQ